jgi:molybdopterin synthase sulfur carrier subunit
MVTVRLYAAARSAAGTDTLVFEPATVQEIIDQCSAINGELKRIIPSCGFLIDGLACHDFSMHVASGSQLDVLPKFAGG